MYSRCSSSLRSRATLQAALSPQQDEHRLTSPQQGFIDRIAKMIGTVLPAPKINKRRVKGALSVTEARRSRRIAGLKPEPMQLGSSNREGM
jgi:hypothetical protein